MPKPGKIENYIRDWLGGQQHGDLLAWCRVSRPVAISNTVQGADRAKAWSVGGQKEALGAMGFAGRESSTIFDTTYAYVLTPSKFLVLQLAGFKERPKQLWIHSPAGGLLLHYVDVTAEHGVFRNFALELPEGRLGPNDKPAPFVHDLVRYTTTKGVRGPFADQCDRFVAAFGQNAARHTISQ